MKVEKRLIADYTRAFSQKHIDMALPAGRHLDFSVPRYLSYARVMPHTTIISSLASRSSYVDSPMQRSNTLYLTRSAQTQKLVTSICIPINMLGKMKYSTRAARILKTSVITEHTGQFIDIFDTFAG